MRIVSLDALPVEGVSHDPAIRKQVLLRKGDVPHLTTFSRAVFSPGQAATAHSHADMHEVFFVASGVGEIRVDGVVHELAAGTCATVAPGETHEIACTGAGELVLLYLGVEG